MIKIRLGLIALAIASILLIIFIPVLTVKAQDVNRPEPECYYTDIKLEEGDSLEKIALIYNTSDYLCNKEYINEVKRINSLCSDTIHAGCYLTVVCYR